MSRKTIIIIVVIILLLMCAGVGTLVGYYVKSASDDVDPILPQPTETTLEFTADKFDGANYNGETGAEGDTFIANLKSTIKVNQGVAVGTFAIKMIEIKLLGASYRLATTEELSKFTLLDIAVDKITTEAIIKNFRVQFGDFSSKNYQGAEFRITIEGILSPVATD